MSGRQVHSQSRLLPEQSSFPDNQWDGSEDTAQEACGSRLSQQADRLEKGQLMSGKSSEKKTNMNCMIIHGYDQEF